MNTSMRNVISATSLAVLITLAFGSSEDSDRKKSPDVQAVTENSAEPENTAEPEKPKNEMAKVGDTVKFSDSEWTVLEAEDMGNKLRSKNEFIETKVSDGGKFIRVKYKVKNLGNKEYAALDGPNVHDGADREYSSLSALDLIGFIEENDKTMGITEQVRPGLAATFVAIYEVPEDATGIQMEVWELKPMFAKTKRVDLGI